MPGITYVSVIVPVFNVGAYVDECLHSIRGQSHGAIEIIVVDDGSTDNSLAVVAAHMAVDDRIRLVRHTANRGLSEARNTGIEAATGTYVVFVDSDDIIDRCLVEYCLTAVIASDLDVLVFDHIVFTTQVPAGHRDGASPAITKRFGVGDPAYFELPYYAWAKFIRRTLLVAQGLRFCAGRNYEDHLFHWQLGLVDAAIGHIGEPLYFYRLRAGAITATVDRSFADQIEMYRLIAVALRPLQVDPKVRDVLDRRAAAAFWFVYFNAPDDRRHGLASMILDVVQHTMPWLPRSRSIPARQRLFLVLLMRRAWPHRVALAAVRRVRGQRRDLAPLRRRNGSNAQCTHPRRVLQVVGTMNRAGAETMVMNLYRHIDRTAIQFDFLYFTDRVCDFDGEIIGLGGRIFRVPATGRTRALSRMWFLFRLLRSDRSISAIHCHNLLASGQHLVAAKLAGVRIRIVHAHSTSNAGQLGLLQSLYRSASRALIRWSATRLVGCGQAAAAYLFGDRRDVTVMPNAIDLRRFAEAAPLDGSIADRASAGEAKCLSIVQVGRLETVKNHVFALSLAARLRDCGIDCSLSIVGQGELRDEIAGQIDQLGLSGHVRLLGPRADVAAIMAAADAMIMPSLYEGFPVVLVEAQASGLPSLVSDRVSHEVDLGLGLVHFLPLTSASAWATRLCAIAAAGKPTGGERIEQMTARGFDISSSAKVFAGFYTGAAEARS